MLISKPTLAPIQTIVAPDPSLGSLSVIQANRDLGFPIKRIYYIHSMTADAERGSHAHKALYQCVSAVCGSVRIELEGLEGTEEYLLDSPGKALLVPPGYWRTMREFAPGTVLLVLASSDYDENDYIRDHRDFRNWLIQKNAKAEDIPYLDLTGRFALLEGEILHETRASLKDARYILGPRTERFEREFAAYCGAEHCIGTGNGLDALELILRAYEISAGDEVIIAASGFIATPLAVLRAGATPVFTDGQEDGNIDPRLIEKAVTPRTRAILLTHLFGIPAEMDEIAAIAKKHGLLVFEDSCQAHGSLFRGRRCGGLADAAAFSFYPTKNLGAFGDGGCATTSNGAAAARMRLLRNYGSSIKYRHDAAGFNSRLDEMQAGLLSALLPYLDVWNEKRRALAALYFDALASVKGLRLPEYGAHVVPNWHIFPVFVKNGRRDALAEHLRKHGIGTNIHYPVPMHLQPCCAPLCHAEGAFPVAERLCAEELSLPLDPFKTETAIKRVAGAVRAFFNQPEPS